MAGPLNERGHKREVTAQTGGLCSPVQEGQGEGTKLLDRPQLGLGCAVSKSATS